MRDALLEQDRPTDPSASAPAVASASASRGQTGEARGRMGLAERLAVVASLVTSGVFIGRSAFGADGKASFALFDDAMISMTYARNLARGSGLVWNQGGPAIEGYTNFLWTLWMAAIHAVGIPNRLTSLAVMVSGAVLLALTVVVTARLARAAHPSPITAATAAWMVAVAPSLIFWTLRGMEVGLLACVVAASMLLAVEVSRDATLLRLAGIGALLAAGLLTRTDFVVLALVVAVFATAWSARAARARVAWATFGVVVATLAAHTVFRVVVYGAAMPNTFALKLGGVPLLDRFDRGAAVLLDVVGIEVVVPALVVALGFVVDRRGPSRLEQLSGALIVAAAAYVVWTGGDAWEWMTIPNRYLAPVLPALALLVGLAVAKIGRATTRGPRVVALVACALTLVIVAARLPSSDAGRQLASGKYLRVGVLVAFLGVVAIGIAMLVARVPRSRARMVAAVTILSVVAMPALWWVRINAPYIDADAHQSTLGSAFARFTTPDAVLAVVSAGSVVYFADRRAVDLLGKSDLHVATTSPRDVPFVPGHVKFDYAWSIGRLRPDLVTALYGDRAGARAVLRRAGYERIGDGVYVRADSTEVDVDGLSRHLERFPATVAPASHR